ncbi:MAG: bifunctional (p)ppGpp synthetase/guanosine-3',5'-bis(diphosphate) 3'-pyrophosphohydrolase, partial [Chloroflexi bacterium]|nr:bifunctional (p)ppGpp synthetase/guanosine-3',5'-bis(diphosphate) 3'-pyrophosphohydrolase [Chloroflexota bacterium]
MAEALAHPSETGAAQHASGDRALAELLAQVRSYLPQADLSVVERAYLFAQRAHEGQFRISKEPFFNHPLSAARTLADLQLDPA